MKKWVIIGGGSGLSNLFRGFKNDRKIDITAICTGSDDGGYTRVAVEEYGYAGWIGDFGKLVCSVSHYPSLVKMAQHRVKGGSRNGSVPRNDILTGFLETAPSTEDAIREYLELFKVYPNHHVLPMTIVPNKLHTLVRQGDNLRAISGEANLAKIRKELAKDPGRRISDIVKVFLDPEVPIFGPSRKAIEAADGVILAYGDLISSVLAALAAQGVRDALQNTHTKIGIILNLMTRPGETDGFSAERFVELEEEALGRKSDFILQSHWDKPIPAHVRAQHTNANMVELNSAELLHDPRMVYRPLRTSTAEGAIAHDPILVRRALKDCFSVFEALGDDRHDPEKVRAALRAVWKTPDEDPEEVMQAK